MLIAFFAFLGLSKESRSSLCDALNTLQLLALTMSTTVFNGVLTDTRQPHLVAVEVLAVVLATFFVSLRFAATWRRGIVFCADNLVLLGALVSKLYDAAQA